MVAENKTRQEEEDKARVGLEPSEEDEKPKHKMRADLREVLAKADQLYDSTGQMSEQLNRCSQLLRDMRRYKVTGGHLQPNLANDGAAGSDPAAPTSNSGSAHGEGSGSGESDNAVAMEMPTIAPVYAVPVNVMEELKGVCLSVLQRAIEEMKIWDPQGDLPEMPAQILELLTEHQSTTLNTRGSELWKERLAAYETVSMPAYGSGAYTPATAAAAPANCSDSLPAVSCDRPADAGEGEGSG